MGEGVLGPTDWRLHQPTTTAAAAVSSGDPDITDQAGRTARHGPHRSGTAGLPPAGPLLDLWAAGLVGCWWSLC